MEFSSGTFALPPGTDTITGTSITENGTTDFSNMDLIVVGPSAPPPPEPATLSMLAVGVAGIALARRRERRASD